MDRFVVISGCSGGGKSTLLEELRCRGYAVVDEPGRRIVAQERAGSGRALPWVDPAAFAERAVAMALADLDEAAAMAGLIFFDRGLIDAVTALTHATGRPALPPDAMARYSRRVFTAPPWPEIYRRDEDRTHELAAAIEEYDRLLAAYWALGYTVTSLPKTNVGRRADFVIETLRSV